MAIIQIKSRELSLNNIILEIIITFQLIPQMLFCLTHMNYLKDLNNRYQNFILQDIKAKNFIVIKRKNVLSPLFTLFKSKLSDEKKSNSIYEVPYMNCRRNTLV